MTALVRCEHCGASFEVDDRLTGGITNCPECGKATTVPGLRDGLAWLSLVGVAAAVLAIAVVVGRVAGVEYGVLALIVGALLAVVLARFL
ncbi:MAG: hypothetical protein IPM29_07690 [Planctomycetes bacterium]|nr:hypothetical protein [Planctomycetota bacterium]